MWGSGAMASFHVCVCVCVCVKYLHCRRVPEPSILQCRHDPGVCSELLPSDMSRRKEAWACVHDLPGCLLNEQRIIFDGIR